MPHDKWLTEPQILVTEGANTNNGTRALPLLVSSQMFLEKSLTSTTTPRLPVPLESAVTWGLSTKPLHQSIRQYQVSRATIAALWPCWWDKDWIEATEPISVANIRFTLQTNSNFGWSCLPNLGSARLLLLYKKGYATALTLILLMLFITPVSDRSYRTITYYNIYICCKYVTTYIYAYMWLDLKKFTQERLSPLIFEF